jgi:hypothetical protein
LKKMHPIESLQQLIFTTKIIGKAGNQIWHYDATFAIRKCWKTNMIVETAFA